jgi:hypothetical protein
MCEEIMWSWHSIWMEGRVLPQRQRRPLVHQRNHKPALALNGAARPEYRIIEPRSLIPRSPSLFVSIVRWRVVRCVRWRPRRPQSAEQDHCKKVLCHRFFPLTADCGVKALTSSRYFKKLMLSRRSQVAIRNTTCNPDNGGLRGRRNCLSHNVIKENAGCNSLMLLSRRTQVAICNTTCNPDNGGLRGRRNCLSHTHHPRDIPRQSRWRPPRNYWIIRQSGLNNHMGIRGTASLPTRGHSYRAHPCSLSSNQEKIMQVPNVTEHRV